MALHDGSCSGLYGSLTSRVSALQMFQRTPELMPGTMDVGLHGAERQVERRRDLLVGAPLDVPEHDAGTILRPQLADRALDRGAELARLHLLERRLLLGGDLERRRLDLG